MQLLVNIDHVATLRNARGEGYPSPVEAAKVCEEAGASGIVFHLRKDRRHIRDEDVYALKTAVKGTLDFEMAATREMINMCLDVKPELITLVPESREELTTEGGLNMSALLDDYRQRVYPKGEDQPVSDFVGKTFPNHEASPINSALCMYTLSKDEHFILDHHPQHNNVVIAAGFSGHGL